MTDLRDPIEDFVDLLNIPYRMNTKQILMLAVGGLTLTTTTGCREQEADAAAMKMNAMPPVPVAVMNLQQQDVDIVATWFGHLRGVEQAGIRPEVSGKLLRQVYVDGTHCEKGEVLFEIDPATYKAAVDQAAANVAVTKAAVLQARANDERARLDLERYEALVKNGSISEKTYTDAQSAKKTAEAALAAAEAQVKLAEAALEMAQINLDRCTIRAPFSGLAGNATVSVGDYITANGPALTRMSSVDPIRVDFSVPGKEMLSEVLAAAYNPHSGDTGPIESFELILEDGSVFGQRGRVVAIDSEVSSSTASVSFVGHVPNEEYRLRAGAAVRVRARTGEIKDALLVPVRAIATTMNHHLIYVVAPDGTPRCIDVQLGQSMTLEMPDGKGGSAPMLMQVVTGTVGPIADQLKEMGIEEVTAAPVIVEGTQVAAQYSRKNAEKRRKGEKEGYGKVIPRPFEYTVPTSTTPSVTAKSAAATK